MLYIFELDGECRVSNLDPDSEDLDRVLSESCTVTMNDPRKTSIDTQMGVIRNVLTTGGASVVMR